MGKVQPEYEVESRFIDRLESIGYEYVDLKKLDAMKEYKKGLLQ